MTKYNTIDAFCGAGGLSLGLTNSGYNMLCSFDFDAKCIETLKLNNKYLAHDVRQLDIADVLKHDPCKFFKVKKGELFLLAGGPPCQGFSIQRIGDDSDPRNDLVSRYFDLILKLQPQYFLMENVQGLTGKRGRSLLDSVLSKIQKNGYTIYQNIIDAQDYGVPQRRKRIVVIGERDKINGHTFEFPNPITPEGKRISVKSVIGHLPPPPMDGSDHQDIPHHRRDKLSLKNLERIKSISSGQGRTSLPKHLLADCHKIDASVIGHRNVYGRMTWDDVAPTITARFDSFTRGQFGHPTQNRTISLREGALLQTFPNDYMFSGNKVDIARQIGNAVPPLLGEVIGKQIITYHKTKASHAK